MKKNDGGPAFNENKKTVFESWAQKALAYLREVQCLGVHSWAYEELGCPSCGAENGEDHGGPGVGYLDLPPRHEADCALMQLISEGEILFADAMIKESGNDV